MNRDAEASAITLVEVNCPLCGHAESRPLFTVKDWAFSCSQAEFTLRRCAVCGCGYLSPRPAEDDMPRFYPPEFYWSWEGASEPLAWEEIIRQRAKQLEAKAAWLADRPPGRLLDVGAQKGEFLWYMRQRGWQVEGVEIDPGVPNPARMTIRYGDFLVMELEAGAYDVITFWAVLEHVYRPAAFIEKAAALLKPGGRLVLLVTNLHSIQARWFCQDDYPRHLTIFTKPALQRLCARHGLRLKRLSTDQKIFGGALNGGLVYACKRLGGYSRDEAYSEWKQIRDPHLFWARWRGRDAWFIRQVSRLDRLLTWPAEALFDRLGFGFILTLSFEKERA